MDSLKFYQKDDLHFAIVMHSFEGIYFVQSNYSHCCDVFTYTSPAKRIHKIY